MKKIKILLTALMLGLTSCSVYDKSFSSEETDEKTTLSELSQNKSVHIENVLALKTDNISFNGAFELKVPEHLGVYQVVCIDGFEKNADRVFDFFIDRNTFDEKNITDDGSTYPTGPKYEDKQRGIYAAAGCTGYLSYENNITYEEEGVIYDIEEDKGDVTYLKSDDETYLKAKEQTEKITSACGYPCELEPFLKTKHKSIELTEVSERLVYNGLPISCLFDRNSGDDTLKCFMPPAICEFDSEGSLKSFTVQYALEGYKTVSESDTLLTPEAAVKRLSQELSGYREYKALGMELVYRPTLIGSDEKPPADGSMTHREKAPWCSVCSYDIFELEPYWAIYFDLTENTECFALIGAYNGDVHFVANR